MRLEDWLNKGIPDISKSLMKVHKHHFPIEQSLGFEGQEKIIKILKNFRKVLYPCFCDTYKDELRVETNVGNLLRSTALDLKSIIAKVLENSGEGRPEAKAEEIVIDLLNKLPEIREILQTDIQAAYNGDPAALSLEEILFSYPSITAITIHRIAHELYEAGVPIIPRIMSEHAHSLTGIDIHPGAKIGEYFFIDHGTGVVIGETSTIGKNVKIYQGVTIGAKSFPLDEHGNPIKGIKRHPDIGDNVIIYAGATILGGDTKIGHDSIIGGNIWLTQSVPPYSRIYNSQPLPQIKQKKE
ncbi:serine acetyltransferase [Ureibacillus terrenus]|uniref:Serine acetyltransferase n=1 Tax=Ureibacillus terrenus TaxID=118246 RepID=A0A540V5L6_9BACL|nr:serine O-acetyltransferase EpsC [Ureibacillus terrenus]MED3764309.1 serine acetyltransferase [Ureibacillus terrenus]TQE92008.1 serine acetyltransferase [Ureibacillus terrenus]